MQEERRYTLGKYVFNTENEYNDAKKDLQMIRQLKDKYNVEDRDIAMKIIKAVEMKKVIFHSKIGEDFVRYLVKNIKAEEDILGRISGESEEERTRNIVREELENHQSPINLKSFWKKKLAAKEKLITNDKYSIKYIEEYVYLVVEFLLFAMLFSAWGMASMSYDYGSDPIECYPYGVIWLLAIRVLPIVSFATLVGYIRGMIKNHHCWNRNVYCSQYISIWIYTVGAFIYKNIFSDVYRWKNAWKVITNKEYLEVGRYYNLIYNGQWDPEYGILEATLLFAWVLLLPVGRMILGIVKWIYKSVQKRVPALEDITPVFMVNPLKRKKLFILLYIGMYFVLFASLYVRASALYPSGVKQSDKYYSSENFSNISSEGTVVTTPTVVPTITPTQQWLDDSVQDILGGKVKLADYHNMVLIAIEQEDVDEEITLMLESYSELIEVSRRAEFGDVVNINYSGKMHGYAFEGGDDFSEAGTDLELGSGMFIDGFEDGLIGAIAGETRVLELTYPEDYAVDDYAGENAIFTVVVNKVYETRVPDLTDEFVRKTFNTMSVEEFKKDMYDSHNKEYLSQQIIDILMDGSEVVYYPDAMIAEEKEEIIDECILLGESYASYLGIDTMEAMKQILGIASMDELEMVAEGMAHDRVKNALIISAIATNEEITLTESEYLEKIVTLADEYGYFDGEEFESVYGKDEVRNLLLEEKVMEFLIKSATIVEN